MTEAAEQLHGCHYSAQHGYSEIPCDSIDRTQISLLAEAINRVSCSEGESSSLVKSCGIYDVVEVFQLYPAERAGGCLQTDFRRASNSRSFKENGKLLYKEGIEHGKTGAECKVILVV